MTGRHPIGIQPAYKWLTNSKTMLTKVLLTKRQADYLKRAKQSAKGLDFFLSIIPYLILVGLFVEAWFIY